MKSLTVVKMTNKITPLGVLRRWKTYVRLVYRTVKEITPEAEVYVTGGAAENRLTIRSDIDILIALSNKPSLSEAVELHSRIIEKAEEFGLPPYAPVELHIISKGEIRKYTRKSKVVPAEKVY